MLAWWCSVSTEIDLAPGNAYGLTLKNRVLAAAGCLGYGVEYERVLDLGQLGAVVTRSTTLHGRRVGRAPRLIETPAGLLAAGAWPDPGLERVLARYAPIWAGWATPVLLSVAGDTPDDYVAVAAALEGVEGVAGLELNLAAHPERAARITAAVRAATLLPILAKLPLLNQGLAALAQSVAAAGADAITAIGSPRGLAADPAGGAPISGRFSGPALRPLALAAVAEVAAAVEVPVVACGGIATAEEARQFIQAGASAVQVGAALLADPFAAARIAAELADTVAQDSHKAV
jgi:dihydroorotate dehydrogenase (NAD+) catalytic subunit